MRIRLKVLGVGINKIFARGILPSSKRKLKMSLLSQMAEEEKIEMSSERAF